MPRVKLDAGFCLAATCPPHKKKETYWDTSGCTGFTLEVRANGGKTYYLRYFDGTGKQVQLKIGRYEDISFAAALKAAKRLRADVVLGGNPAATKAEKKAVPTYVELAKQHLAFAETHLRSHANIEVIQRLHLLPRWGRMKLSEIKQQDIATWLAEKEAEGLAPATVEKLRVTLNRSFELARRWNIPGSEINPVKGVPRKRLNNARNRSLTTQEVERLKSAVEASPNTQLKWIVGLCLLCGNRISELLHAKWEHIDVEGRTWYIPKTKNGHPRYVPLSQPALDIIAQLPKFKNCPYLVPNPETKKPFVSIKHSWQTARKEARLGDLRIHDLRHAALSFAANAGVDIYTIATIAGHKDLKSTIRYSHLQNKKLLDAAEMGAKAMNVAWANEGGRSDGE